MCKCKVQVREHVGHVHLDILYKVKKESSALNMNTLVTQTNDSDF